MIDTFAFFSIYLVAGVAVVVGYTIMLKPTGEEVRAFLLAVFFRMLCTYYYYYFTLKNSADSGGYFGYAQTVGFVPSFSAFLTTGTDFTNNVAALFFPFVSPFENKYLMLFIPFSLFGLVGSFLFYRTFRIIAPLRKKTELYLLSFFMPNLIFWTSNLGKDSLTYFAISLVMYGFLAKPKAPWNLLSIGLGGVLVYSVRPHFVMFLLCGFLLGWLFEGRRISLRSFVMFAVMFMTFLALHRAIFEYAGLGSANEDQQASKTSYLAAGVSRVEMSSQGISEISAGGAAMKVHRFSPVLFPYYLFTFLTVPYFWQVRKLIHFVSACETVIYQIMIIYIIAHWKIFNKINFIPYKYAWVIYLLLASIIEGASQPNFGLIVRQRCMVLPVILLMFAGVRYQVSLDGVKKKAKAMLKAKGGVLPVARVPISTIKKL